MISQLRVCIKYSVEMFPTVWTNISITFVAIFRAVGTGEARAFPVSPIFVIKKGNRGKKGNLLLLCPHKYLDIPTSLT